MKVSARGVMYGVVLLYSLLHINFIGASVILAIPAYLYVWSGRRPA